MTELPLDKVMDFLKRVRPFSELPEPALKDVSRSILIDYFPEGQIILSPGKVDDPFLYLVFSGVAHCFAKDETRSCTLKYVSEGDHFGSETILTGQCEHTVQAQEDTICYLVKPEVFLNLEKRLEGFKRYFRTMDSTLAAQISAYGDFEAESASPRPFQDRMISSQFKTSIGALISREPVCCEPETTVSEIARIMGLDGVGSVIVMENENPAGIITKNDLTEKILARKRGGDVQASEIMSKIILSMDHQGSCFEASLGMVENHCHHMVAMNGDELYGVISQHDLILLQGANPVAVVGSIDKQKDVAGIKKCVRDMSIVQQVLLAEGGRIEQIWALMSTFRDTLTRRLVVLGIEEMRRQGKEPPVLEFCWITFGTPGRKETLLRENFLEGLMYKDPENRLKDETEAYFESLALKVKNGLTTCGLLHRLYGQVLCLPESKWQQRFMALVEGKVPPDSKSLRMFDLRGICEQQDRIDNFRKYLSEIPGLGPKFMKLVRTGNDPTTIPISFYRDKVVTSGGHRESLSLKNDVLTPLVNTVRALALEKGIRAFSTTDRIKALSDVGVIDTQEAMDLRTAYQWLVEMSLKRALEEEKSLDWILDPRKCSSDEKRLLTKSFKLIRGFVETAS